LSKENKAGGRELSYFKRYYKTAVTKQYGTGVRKDIETYREPRSKPIHLQSNDL
jgi:hypothetical protein